VRFEGLTDQREYGPSLGKLALLHGYAIAAKEHLLTTNSRKLGQFALPFDMEECAIL
jgi:hypothetical protein